MTGGASGAQDGAVKGTEESLRFGFGRNWADFIAQHFNETRVESSRQHLLKALRAQSLDGLSFLDIGCGSGLHSLAALREPWPEALVLEGWTLAGLPMIVRHREQPRFGVQFHPESILSPVGPALLARFLERCGEHLAPHDSPILRPLARPTDAG